MGIMTFPGMVKDWTTLKKLIWLKGTALRGGTVTVGPSAIASFTASKAAPLNSLMVDLPYKAGGYTEVNIISANKNLVEEYGEHSLASIASGELVYRNTAGTSLLFRCKAGVTYYLKRGADANRSNWGFFSSKPIPGTSVSDAHVSTNTQATAPLTGWCVVCIKTSSFDEATAQASQISTFAPTDVVLPATTVIPISIPTPPGTVYGGTLDVINGVLTSTKDADGNDITPVEYTLTGEQVNTLVGQNNIWSDAGDVTLEYAK